MCRLYRAMDIEWDDKPARASASFRNFELFDAPHVAFLCMDEGFGLGGAWDIGMYAQTMMLAMTVDWQVVPRELWAIVSLVREAWG